MDAKVRIGTSELYVNPIGIGTNAVGGHNIYPDLDERAGKELVHQALEHQMNMLDTAYYYGPERSEELIGEVLKERGNRSEAVLATKGAHKKVNGAVEIDNTPAFLKQQVEASLKRLQTDYIDLYYIHYPDQTTPKAEAVGALKELKDQGKIRAIGVSNFSLQQLQEANRDGYVDVIQGHYNLIERSAERDIFPYVNEQGISYIPYFPFASGLLAGKYSEQSIFKDFRKNMPHFQGELFRTYLNKVEKVRHIAEEKGVQVAHVVLAWYLKQQPIDVVIPGAKRAEQVIDNLKALDVQLTNDEITEIDQLFQSR